ncbi:MAG: hypothetical protein ACI4Q8_01260 [Ruminococcus sp.]
MAEIDTIKRNRAVKIAAAINSIEGVDIPKEAENLFTQWAKGKLTDGQLVSTMFSMCSKA